MRLYGAAAAIRPPQRRIKMTEKWDKTDATQEPLLETVSTYVSSPLWEQLCKYVEEQYQIRPVLEYSRCSMQRGWNVKYKKAGRSLCTLYPMEGYFIALVVIGERERVEAELALPLFTEYLQQLYYETKAGMGQKWLMINVTDDAVLKDVKRCIAIRRGIRAVQ
jgi:AraC family transcriptional regulator